LVSLLIDAGARSDVGLVRKNNEDAYRVEPTLDLYVLCDGMGGEAHGEVASTMAADAVVTHCLEAQNNLSAPLFGEPRTDLSEASNRLASAVTLANRKIFEEAAANPLHRGMGTTIVAAWLKNGRLSLAHVGDSRAYLLRGGALEQLTADHSLVAENVRRGIMTPQEAESSNLQSVLIRALGSGAEVQVDVSEHALLEGDMLVLCSDGLTRMVTDPEIASTMTTVEPAQAAANRLIELANEYGGVDNATVIVVRMLQGSNGLLARLKRWTTGADDGPTGKSSA
jgi:serine/threonine protein phosphatase PrpC